MTTPALLRLETETPLCILCSIGASRTLGEIRMDGQLLARMVQCEQCGLRFLSPRPAQAQRDWLYEQEYDPDLPGEHGETRFQSVQGDQDRARTRFDRYLDQVEPIRKVRSGGERRLLDVGAGTGQLLALARERGWAVAAVEPSGDACQSLREQFGAGSVVGRDLADLRDGVESYDAVIMAHVIEHLPDPLAALRSAWRLLAPGGRLVVATPNEASLYEWLWQARQRWRGGGPANSYVAIVWRNGRWYRMPIRQDHQGLIEFQILTTEHLYFFTRHTLGQLFQRAGFSRLRWARGSVATANSRLGRLLRNDSINRALFLLGLQAELVAVADKEGPATA